MNEAQIAELVAGPLATALPVVLVGDLNAEPGSASMQRLDDAGFVDTALTAASRHAGPTCCFNARVTGGSLTSRIDHVFYRGSFDAVAQRRTGHLEADRMPGGLPLRPRGCDGRLQPPADAQRAERRCRRRGTAPVAHTFIRGCRGHQRQPRPP